METGAILAECPLEGVQVDVRIMQRGESDPALVNELASIVESLVRSLYTTLVHPSTT